MYIIKECKNILFYSILLYSSCIERLLSVVLRQRACTDAWNMSPDVSLHLWTLSQHGRQDKAIIMYFLCNYNVMQARAHTHTYMCECLHICKFISVCAQACLRKNDWERVCVCVCQGDWGGFASRLQQSSSFTDPALTNNVCTHTVNPTPAEHWQHKPLTPAY